MSLQYDEYLKEHIQNVTNGLHWIMDNLDLKKFGIFESDISAALENAGEHDRSKYDVIEYRAYDDYFYGGNKSYAVKTAFDQAWLHHQHVNPHHWQYWVLINDDDGVNKALPMPEDYILEMIADWWSFSWREGNLMEIFDWYDKHRNVILFEEETRKTVEKILAEMRKVLEMQQKHENGYVGDADDDHLEHHGILGQKWGQRNGPPYPLNRSPFDDYTKETITKTTIDKYKDQAKQLSHVRVNANTNGTIFTNNGKLVGMINVEEKDDGHRWIQGLELFNNAKGKGLSYDLLDYATNELGATHLSVNKANSIAKHVYDKYGFQTYDETDDMYFMKFEDHLEHHGILGQKWGVRRYQNADGSLTEEGKKRYRKTVFVSGSSKTQTEDSPYYRKELPSGIQKELDKHIEKHDRILVGDAPGIDRQVQDYLNEKNYDVVEVYGPGKQVRYSANSSWKTNPIDAPEFEEGSKEWLAKKDIAMSKEADEGLAIILDEGAKATRKNVQRMRDDDKDVKVYMLDQNGLDLDRWLTQRELKDVIVHSDVEEDKHQYGVPEQKKFPLPDADHVRSAIRFFNWVDPKYEKELAKAILEKMDEYGMSFDDFGVGDENRLKKYMPEEDLKKNEEKSKCNSNSK